MVLITLPVHIFLTLQLEGKLAQKIILLYVGWGLNWATSSGAENLYFNISSSYDIHEGCLQSDNALYISFFCVYDLIERRGAQDDTVFYFWIMRGAPVRLFDDSSWCLMSEACTHRHALTRRATSKNQHDIKHLKDSTRRSEQQWMFLLVFDTVSVLGG